jgi:hypothetical protein
MNDVNKYEITELGIYSLGSDQFATSASRMLINFTQTESWQYYDASTKSFSDLSLVTGLTETFQATPFFASADDGYWNATTYRKLRMEQPRQLGDAVIVPGNMGTYTAGAFTSASNYVILSDTNIDLSKASSTDSLLLAFSIANADATASSTNPTNYYIVLEFTYGNGTDYARAEFSDTIAKNFGNRYIVDSIPISSITTTSGFNWKNVTSVKVYSSVQVSGTSTNKYAIVLDGLRYENNSVANPLYALTAYTIVNNTTADKLSKKPNSNNLINFRIDLALGG